MKLPSKVELLTRLEVIMQADEFGSLTGEGRAIIDRYQINMKIEEREQLKAHRAIQIELPEEDQEDFKYKQDETDVRFKAIRLDFFEKRAELKKKKNEQINELLEKKMALVIEFQALLDDGMTEIKTAFKKFDDIQERWNGLKEIDSPSYKKVHYEYSHCLDVFYYNVKIYKEFKNYDLQKNLENKQAVIEELKQLEELQDVRILRSKLRNIHLKWEKIGPTFQEKWESLKQDYWCRVVDFNDYITEELKKKVAIQEENRKLKNTLIEELQEWYNGLKDKIDAAKHDDWSKWKEEAIVFRDKCKDIGHSGQSHSILKWQELDEVLDAFFTQRKSFYASQKEMRDVAKEKKLLLIKEAEKNKDSKDWKKTGVLFDKLHNDWKKIERVRPSEEQKLWNQFSAASNHFYNQKNEYFSTLGDRKKENYTQKIKIAESLSLAKSTDELSEKLVQFHAIGYVPKEKINKVNMLFEGELSKAAQSLSLAEDQKENLNFKTKIIAIKQQENAEDLLLSEKKYVRSQLDKIKDEIIQYENNMSFFGPSKGAQKLKEAVEKRLDAAKENLAKWEAKLKMIR